MRNLRLGVLCVCLFAALGCRALGPLRAGPLEELLKEQANCVKTPEEYKAAFEAREARCVSPELVGRVTSARSTDKLGEDTEAKLAYFWSGSDALAKYLRIGFPQDLGYSLPGSDAGLLSDSSGFAFMRQVGYSAAYLDVSKVYQLRVMRRSVLANATRELDDGGLLPYSGGVAALMPTWAAVRAYYEHVFANSSLLLPDAALELLQNSSFAQLTGCPAYCYYAADAFPSVNQTVPVVSEAGLPPDGACPRAPARTQLTYSEDIDPASALCAPDWQDALAAAKGWFPSFGCTNNSEAGGALAAALDDAAADPRRQALLFRAFLLQYCAGGFYGPFSGDGMTYSGLGGLLAPTGTEFISSPFTSDPLWEEEGEVATMDLCLSGLNGGRPGPNGTCPLPPRPPGLAGAGAAAAAGRGGGRRLLRG